MLKGEGEVGGAIGTSTDTDTDTGLADPEDRSIGTLCDPAQERQESLRPAGVVVYPALDGPAASGTVPVLSNR